MISKLILVKAPQKNSIVSNKQGRKKNWGGALNNLIRKINCVKLSLFRQFIRRVGLNKPPTMGETMAKKKAKKAKRKTTKKAKKTTRKKAKRR